MPAVRQEADMQKGKVIGETINGETQVIQEAHHVDAPPDRKLADCNVQGILDMEAR